MDGAPTSLEWHRAKLWNEPYKATQPLSTGGGTDRDALLQEANHHAMHGPASLDLRNREFNTHRHFLLLF